MASSKGSGLKPAGKKASKSAKAVAVAAIPAGPPPKWVVVQLTSLGEKEKNIDVITRSVRRILGDVEVFIPAYSQKVRNESHTMFYMDGYIFVRHRVEVNYMKLQETMYFKSVICAFAHGKKTYALLDDFVLDKMRDGVKSMKTQGSFQKDMDVKIVQGELKGLKGKVNLVYENGEKIQVFVPLTSKPILIEFPSNFLERIDST